jgi:hypothetical protein
MSLHVFDSDGKRICSIYSDFLHARRGSCADKWFLAFPSFGIPNDAQRVIAAIRADRRWHMPAVTTPVRRLDEESFITARGPVRDQWVPYRAICFADGTEPIEIGSEIAIYEEPSSKARFVAVYERTAGDITSGPTEWLVLPPGVVMEVAPTAKWPWPMRSVTLQGQIVSAYRDGDSMVLQIDRGRANGVEVGMAGGVIAGPSGEQPVDGGLFTVFKRWSHKSLARSSLKSLGSHNRVLINLRN